MKTAAFIVRLQGQPKVFRYVEKKILNYILIIFRHFKHNEIEIYTFSGKWDPKLLLCISRATQKDSITQQSTKLYYLPSFFIILYYIIWNILKLIHIIGLLQQYM